MEIPEGFTQQQNLGNAGIMTIAATIVTLATIYSAGKCLQVDVTILNILIGLLVTNVNHVLVNLKKYRLE